MPTQENETGVSVEFRSLLDRYSEIIEAFTPDEHPENSEPLADALRTYAVEPYLVCRANEPVSFTLCGFCYLFLLIFMALTVACGIFSCTQSLR
jgi:hypothetical protein